MFTFCAVPTALVGQQPIVGRDVCAALLGPRKPREDHRRGRPAAAGSCYIASLNPANLGGPLTKGV